MRENRSSIRKMRLPQMALISGSLNLSVDLAGINGSDTVGYPDYQNTTTATVMGKRRMA